MTRVAGAWSHRVYRLETSRSAYAVKHMLDPWQDETWRSWLGEAWDFELAAFAAGVSMPRPVPSRDGGCLADVESDDRRQLLPVRVHEWVDAQPCPMEPVDRTVAEQLGEDLVRMHALRHVPRRRDVFPQTTGDNVTGWPVLVERLRKRDRRIAHAAGKLGPWIARVGELFDAADSDFGSQPMSHGDIDQKNVLLGNAGPVLCDWDVASPWEPRAELVRTALSLACWQRPEVARWTVAAYQSAGGAASPPFRPEDLAIDLVIGVDWLVLCLERATGLRPTDPDEQHEARKLIPRLLADFPHQVRTALDIEAWIDGDGR